ncbi:Ceramide synthase hyl-1 [Picochlorum sp. SENEW3]|nr:Ceramide synthase hyl-1 [Picochlorum sp. SENEW3]
MAIDVLPWLLKGKEREEYDLLNDVDNIDMFSIREVIYVICCLLGIIGTRVAFNSMISPWAGKQARARNISQREMNKVLEEIWVLIGNTVTLSLAVYVMLYENNGCWFGNTAPCLVGWPNHSVNPAVLLYYTIEFAWYIHLLLKKPLGYGEPDGKDMKMHHVASLLLLFLSKAFNLTRGGILVLTLFSISNPALHAAKICNQMAPAVRVPMFIVFSALFMVTRVIMVPFIILRMSIFESVKLIPYAVKDFMVPFIAFNVLLVLLYVMQIQWMWAIIKVLKKSAVEGASAAAELSTELDPSKRFASTNEEKKRE